MIRNVIGSPSLYLLWAVVSLPLLALFGQSNASSANSPANTETRRQQLHSLFEEQWQYELRLHPEFATAIGDNRYNDRLSDESASAIQAEMEQTKKFLSRFEDIDPSGLPKQDVLSRELMIRELKLDLEGARFKAWEMPVNQREGPHLDFPDLITITPFNTVQDYDNYLSRLRQMPHSFDQVMANMKQGMRDGLMQPRYLLEKVVPETEEVANEPGESSPFYKPLTEFPAVVPEADQKRLRAAVLSVINDEIVPAYKRFATFVRDDYAPHGRTEPGVWSLPDGDARYQYAIRRMTTTDLSPDAIHNIGMKELQKTEAEMLAVAHKFGFNDLPSFNEHIKNDRKLYASSGQQLLDLYAKYVRDMQPKLPQLFGRLPKAKLVAIPMDAARAPNGVPADYMPGTADGSRPGHINVNEWDPEHRLLLNVEAIAYHEGIPGHHLQISIAQELTDLPAFRRFGDYTAFIEGWAFYAERLSKEVGGYQDPYSEYGRLENEMWRDIRLVVDTGVHAEHWSRDQMVEYFHKYTAMDEPNIQTEVDRYICWPGQALAYKLGQLEILKLREEARQKLGAKFDIRAFHDAVIDNGPLPLGVLDSQVEDWIAEQPGH
ncbi:MAG TPA: DUF885 domain-containing protein [Terriglobales bacterium]|nr:DUF885 domain-containing protein [Terriglobales bacterium]